MTVREERRVTDCALSKSVLGLVHPDRFMIEAIVRFRRYNPEKLTEGNLSDAGWFHTTGITCAISPEAANESDTFIKNSKKNVD